MCCVSNVIYSNYQDRGRAAKLPTPALTTECTNTAGSFSWSGAGTQQLQCNHWSRGYKPSVRPLLVLDTLSTLTLDRKLSTDSHIKMFDILTVVWWYLVHGRS